MKLSEILAVRCLAVKSAALDPAVARDEFENLGSRERVARGMVDRFSNIAKDRALEESEKSPTETMTDRLWPIPHTKTEALVRLPMVGAGGYAGHEFAKGLELPDATGLRELVARTVKETAPKAPAEPALSQMGSWLRDRFQANKMQNPAEAAQHLESIIRQKPELLPEWLAAHAAAAPGQQLTGVPGELGKHFGGDSRSALSEIAHEYSRRNYHVGSVDHSVNGVPAKKTVLRKGSLAPADVQAKVPDATADLVKHWDLPKAVAKSEGAAAPQAMGQLGQRLLDRLTREGHTLDSAAQIAHTVERAIGRDPGAGRKALSWMPDVLIGDGARTARREINDAVGGRGKKLVSEEIRHIIHKLPATSGTQWKRYGMAGLGIAGASALTGIPLALRALYQRRHGGEAAVRAKSRVKEELSTAEQAANRRAEILKELAA